MKRKDMKYILFQILIILLITFISITIIKRLRSKENILNAYNNTFVNSNSLNETSYISFNTNSNKNKDINNLSVNINNIYNNNEKLKNINLKDNDNNFEWIRYNKNDLLIIKSAFYPRYITVKNFNQFNFDELNTKNNFVKPIMDILKNNDNIKINREVFYYDEQFIKFITNVITNKKNFQILSFNLDEDLTQVLFDDIYININKNLESFIKEEEQIEKRLNYKKSPTNDISNLLNSFINNFNTIDSNITLEIKDEILHNINISIRGKINNEEIVFKTNVKIKNINETLNIEDESFFINNVNLEEL